MTRPPPNDINLYSDHLHPVTLPHGRNRKRPLSSLPATVIDAPRRSWCEDATAVMEVRLKRLTCDEVVEINGVRVQRTDAFGRLTFHINDERSQSGTPIRYTLAAAIDRVLAIGGRNG